MNCKDKGYEEGDVFKRIVENGRPHTKGVLLVLQTPGCDCPNFFHLTGDYTGKICRHSLEHVKRIYPPEKETVSITIEGKKAEISRESAIELKKALNLIQDL